MSQSSELISRNNTNLTLEEEIKGKLISSLLSSDKSKNEALNFRGMRPSEDNTNVFKFAKKKIEDEGEICKKAEENIKNFRTLHESHKEKVKELEKGLKLLLKLYQKKKENCSPRTFTLLAKTYLLRSRVFRPRGFTIPKKKEEALEKGLFYLSKIKVEEVNGEAQKIKALIYLEREKIKIKDKDLEQVLEGAVKSGCTDFSKDENNENIFNIWICLRYCEEIKSGYEVLLDGLTKSNREDIHFEKARACRVLKDQSQMKLELAKAIKNLEGVRFSDPIWNDIVEFLKKLREENNSEWKKLAEQMYEVCEKQSYQTSNIFLRLYWSGLRDLYDLAFLAQDERTQAGLKQKAIIADSLKNRPAARYSVWKKEVSESDWKGEEASCGQAFISKVKELEKQFKPLNINTKSIDEIPNEWIAVHFFLNHLEKEEGVEKFGYALIYNGTNKQWEMEKFKVQKIYKTYLDWQKNYSRLKVENAAQFLVKLCECIGEEMPFLFDRNLFPEERPVVFIPHDFLRRLPLHGAISKNTKGEDTVWLENHPNCYLPSWNFITLEGSKEIINSRKNDGKFLFKYFPEYEYPNLINRIPEENIIDNARGNEIKEKAINPETLILLSHGKADNINPFNSRLLFKNQQLSYRDIQNLKMDLKEAKIFLGACETDLLPPQSDTIDEHLSMSTAFLNKGANVIVSSIWKILPSNLENAFIKLSNNNKLTATFRHFQKEGMTEWRLKNCRPIIFYEIISLRIILKTFI